MRFWLSLRLKLAAPRWPVYAALALLLGAVDLQAGCSGDASADSSGAWRATRLAAPQFTQFEAKTASGPPAGIFVTWTLVDSAIGYYLYRDTQSIPDPNPDGLIDPTLRTHGGIIIAQPPDGTTVTFNDIFDPVLGQTYYYRVTAVDATWEEGYASNEMSWQVHGQNVTGLAPLSAYWGDSVTISGDTFGVYDALTDSVQFPDIWGGSVAGIIEQPTDWTDTQIVVTVPPNSVSGQLGVVIDGTLALTDDTLAILNPFISTIAPNPGFVEQELVLSGGNFGDTPGASTVMLGALDLSADVTAWAAAEIRLLLPPETLAGNVFLTVDGHPSNVVAFVPRVEILSAAPVTVQSGEPLSLSGRFFGAAGGRVLLDGAAELAVTSWTDSAIDLLLVGSLGAHTLTVETAGAVLSNDWNFTIEADLTCAISGLNPLAYYTPATAPTVGVATAADAERVELYIDGALARTSTTAPFDDIVLPVGNLFNGAHQVHLRAWRRAVSVDSEFVDVNVYSLNGDINGDGVVDTLDRDELALRRGLTSSDGAFRPWFDTDGDGLVTEADLSAVGYGFGMQITPLT